MELTFPATAVGGYQEQVEQKINFDSTKDQNIHEYWTIIYELVKS